MEPISNPEIRQQAHEDYQSWLEDQDRRMTRRVCWWCIAGLGLVAWIVVWAMLGRGV